MPAPRVSVKAKIFELEIVLAAVAPAVRRRVQVPGGIDLAVLHGVVQSAVGWTNSHLHEFEIAGAATGSRTRTGPVHTSSMRPRLG
jgi:hypothetical protein